MKHKKHQQKDKTSPYKVLLIVAKLFSASKYKSKLLYLSGLLLIAILSFSINDQEAIILYLNKTQELSDHKVHYEQKKHVQEYYINNNNKDPLKHERQQTRNDFNKKKKHLKQQWETFYKIKWPQSNINTNLKFDKKNTNLNNSHIQQYEAHHIVPINSGGCNQWWNISPISSKNHHILHDSIEEKACFSHDFLHKKFVRFVLKVQCVFMDCFSSYINKKGVNYAK